MKKVLWRLLRAVGLGLILGAGVFWWKMDLIGSDRLEAVRERVEPSLKRALAAGDLHFGAPVFVRVLKEENEMELWVEKEAGKPWKRFRKWKIASFSGTLGPKLREGDMQAPEGFYEVGIKQLNPMSRFHLSFNIGYPNAYDRHHGRTGSLIMVHGSNVSIGCFAMTDPVIEEIYLLVEAALKNGQKAVPVHVFPFRMSEERLVKAEAEGSEWASFWRDELRAGYEAFEKSGVPPVMEVVEGRYQVSAEK